MSSSMVEESPSGCPDESAALSEAGLYEAVRALREGFADRIVRIATARYDRSLRFAEKRKGLALEAFDRSLSGEDRGSVLQWHEEALEWLMSQRVTDLAPMLDEAYRRSFRMLLRSPRFRALLVRSADPAAAELLLGTVESAVAEYFPKKSV